MMKECQDKSGKEYQRLTWDALRKSLNGIVNKVNGSNIREMLPELFSEVHWQYINALMDVTVSLLCRIWFEDEDCFADLS